MPRFALLSRSVYYTVGVVLLLFAGCDAGTDGLTAPTPETATAVDPAASLDLVFIPPVCDDAGPNDVPEQSDLNCFTRADDEPGVLGIRWWWDDTNVWTGSGQTGDACGLVDTDTDGFANVAVCAQFTNNAAGTQVIQLPTAGTALVYECSDKKNDRCTKQITRLTLAQIGSTTCGVALGSEPTSTKAWQGDDFPADVVATCEVDLTTLGITSTNLLNVCSYPSGEPNSNPFDCVITPGAGYLRIQKATSPATTANFGFTLSPGNVPFNVPGDDGLGGPGSSALIPVNASGTYALTETVPGGWTLTGASCSPSTGSFNGTNAITGISVTEGQTVTCTFQNSLPPGITVTKTASPTTIPESGGSVEFSLVVTNTSTAAVSLNSLSDDVFGDVADGSNAAITGTTCALPQALAAAGEAGASYSCSFTASLAGAAGGMHVDTVTASASNAGGTATAKDSAKVTYVDVEPGITVVKTALTAQVPETGGNADFKVLITNTAAESVTVDSIVDDKFGDLDGQGTCSVPQSLAAAGLAGDDYMCTFTGAVPAGTPGVPHVNEVTAWASDDDDNDVSAADTARVDLGAVAPMITVTKSADPDSVPETGGTVEFTVIVDNTSAETITITSLSDDQFGNLNGKGTCAVPQVLQPNGLAGDSYSCAFSESVSGNVGVAHVNLATASGADDDGTPVSAADTANVHFKDVLADISVTKTANPTSVPETGGDVTFTVLVENDSDEPVTLNSLVDDVFGNLHGQGDCSVPQSLAASGQAGASYGCSFSQAVAGDYGTFHVDTVTASADDDDGGTATARDSARVTFTDVLPDITVTKTVSPTTLEAGAVTPVPPGPGPGGGFVYLGWVCDTAGPDDVPAQSDVNCFTRADNQAPDVLAVKWTWDNTNVWTGTGQTGDACALFDTDPTVNGFADVAVCAQFTNNATGTEVVQLPSAGSAIVWSCSDKKGDRCTKQIASISSIGTTTCTVTRGTEPGPPAKSWTGDDTPNDVIAECALDLAVLPIPSTASLLNVCSFPSGEPNSNPFDCVVTPGAGYLVIEKATTPSSGEGFEFTVSPNPITNGNPYAVAGDDGSGGAGSSAIIPVTPGTYSITETLETNWDLVSVTCSDGSGTFNGSNAITGITVSEGETVTCTFTNDWSLTGDVIYTIEVTNNSLEAATLNYLDDDKFDNLDGQGSCSLNQALAPTGQAGDEYTCSFTKSLTGSAGDTHTNVVTARASDDDGNTDEETDDADVTFVGP